MEKTGLYVYLDLCLRRFDARIPLSHHDQVCGDPGLARDLAEVARRDKLTLSEFARRELRSAMAARRPGPAGRTDDDGPGPFRRAPGLREAA